MNLCRPKAGTSSGKRGSDHDSDVEIVKKWNTRSRGRDGTLVTYITKLITKRFSLHSINSLTGFQRRLENENGHRKVRKRGKLAKNHRILFSVMEFYQFCP